MPRTHYNDSNVYLMPPKEAEEPYEEEFEYEEEDEYADWQAEREDKE